MGKKNLHSGTYLRMCAANTLVCTYIFANFTLLCVRPGGSVLLCGLALAAFAVWMYVPGPFNAYLVERYARKSIYLKSLLLLLLLNWAFARPLPAPLLIAAAGLQGMVFAIAQNALGNTMVNDLLTSERRTAGDNLYSWYGRLGLPFGWAAALLLPYAGLSGHAQMQWLAALPCVAAFLLILSLSVPLKAPVQTSLFSTDRFWLGKAWPLFLLAFAAAALEGIVTAWGFIAPGGPLLPRALYMGLGFLLALWLQYVVFLAAENRAEMVAGVLLMAAALLLLSHPHEAVRNNAAFILAGAGVGLLSARSLMYFLKLAGHCQRGTAQNTYMLAWRTGFAAGFLLPLLLPASSCGGQTGVPHPSGLPTSLLICGLLLLLLLLLGYLFCVHPWFEHHKDRGFKFRTVG